MILMYTDLKKHKNDAYRSNGIYGDAQTKAVCLHCGRTCLASQPNGLLVKHRNALSVILAAVELEPSIVVLLGRRAAF
jgi:hypothetical protein